MGIIERVRRSSIARLLLALGLTVAVGVSAPLPARAEVTIQPDILYAEPGGFPLYMDVYSPSGTGPFPGVVVVDGSAWQRGDRKRLPGPSTLVADAGMVAFAIDYRLAPQFHYPAQIEDVQSAVTFIRQHAAEFHVDPSEIGGLGPSAGGHLVGLLATMGEGSLDAGTRIRAGVSWSGPMDLSLAVQDGEGQVGNAVAALLGCDLSSCQPQLDQASPVTYADPTDAALFMANSEQEFIPISTAVEMAGVLTQEGVPNELVRVPGTGHGTGYDDESTPSLNGETVGQASVAWLQQYLTTPRSPGSTPTTSPSGSATTPTGTTTAPTPPATTTGRSRPPRGGKGSNDWLLPGIVAGAVLVGAVAALAIRSSRFRRGRTPPPGRP
jgi:acetyl esterase/lipase